MRYPKPFAVKQLLQRLPGLLSKSMASQPCALQALDFKMGCAPEVKLEGRGLRLKSTPVACVAGVQIGNVEPYKSQSLLMIDSITVKAEKWETKH